MHGLARNVLRETWRRARRELSTLEALRDTLPPVPANDRLWDCFDRCLAGLEPERAELLVAYYSAARRLLVVREGGLEVARAFLNAGADAVAMALWRVPDASTAELMRRFYRHLAAGRPAAEALRDAKLELREGREARRAPFHWAGVVLTGDADSALPGF